MTPKARVDLLDLSEPVDDSKNTMSQLKELMGDE